MADDILKQLLDLAVKEKPNAKSTTNNTPVGRFISRARFMIEKAKALNEQKSSFEIGKKSFDTSETRGDWFKRDGVNGMYWVQFKSTPIDISVDPKNPRFYMLAKDLDQVVDILNKGIALSETDTFAEKIIASYEKRSIAAKGAATVAPTIKDRRTRGPNKPKK